MGFVVSIYHSHDMWMEHRKPEAGNVSPYPYVLTYYDTFKDEFLLVRFW